MSENSVSMTEIDPNLLQDFLSESLEALDGLDPLFVQLEGNPSDTSIVDGIFRPVHSVKGNSGFFGLTNIKNFAHVMENILGEIRSRKRQTNPNIIDVLLKGVDFLRSMMVRLSKGDLSGEFTEEEKKHLEILNKISEAGDDKNTIEDYATDILETITELKSHCDNLSLVEKVEKITKILIQTTLPNFFSKNAESKKQKITYQINEKDVSNEIHIIEDFLNNINSRQNEEASCESFNTALQNIKECAGDKIDLIKDIDQIKDDFSTIHNSGIGFDELMASLLNERYEKIIGQIEKNTPEKNTKFIINKKDITENIIEIQGFIEKIQGENENDKKKCEKFLENIKNVKEAFKGKSNLEKIIDKLKDDFLTIYNSGIGFDELTKSLLEDRLSELTREITNENSHSKQMCIDDVDITKQAKIISEFYKNIAEYCCDENKVVEVKKCLEDIKEIAKQKSKKKIASMIEDMENRFVQPLTSGDDVTKEIQESFKEKINELLEIINSPHVEEIENRDKEKNTTKVIEQNKNALANSGSGKTLRVAEEKVDNFMNFVGELIITGEVFAYIQKKLEQYPETRRVAQEFKNANIAFGELSSNLQRSLMEVRRVPLKSVLQKLPRIVRDTSTQLGKKIELDLKGEDIQIDKSLLEGMESPLVHMVRNSLDHGIETPEERIAKGKPEVGHIMITATATEEKFTLSIKDDGKGIDVDAIKDKAVKRGLLSEDAARLMPDKEAFRLIFAAGLSTAKVVTDVSGRGVGMDVVLSNIIKMNGNITVDSVKDKGTTLSIVLPMTVTLTVIDGLVAKIADQNYIIPLSDVRESVRPKESQIHTIRDTFKMLNVRGELHPLVNLAKILEVDSERTNDPTNCTVVLVQNKKGANAALVVDEIIGQQSVVVKELGKEFESIRCIQGGSILGDGRVGLVLDINGIMVEVGATKSE